MNFASLIKDGTTTIGTGNITTIGAAVGFQSLTAIGAVGSTFDYTIRKDGSAEWEEGIGTLLTSTTFSRAPTASSNGGSVVSFSSGTKDVVLGPTAARAAAVQQSIGPLAVQPITTTTGTLVLNFTPDRLETAYAVTLTQNVAITIGNAPTGYEQRMVVELIQDATGGRVATFANPSWPGGIAPTFDTSANRHNTLMFRAVGNDVEGAAFSINRVPNIPAAPVAPTSITVTPGDAQNTINAAPVTAYPAVSGYTIYRGTSAGAESATPIAANVALPYIDTGRANGTSYYYKVAAVNASGTGPQSPEGSATPAAAVVQAAHYATFPTDTTTHANIYSAPQAAFNPGANAFDMRAKVRMTAWATGANVNLLGTWDSITPANREWRLGLDSAGNIVASWAKSATVFLSGVSAAAVSSPNNIDVWLRATVVPTTGVCTFYTSVDDGATWVQLGTAVTVASSGAVYSPATAPYLVIGQNASGAPFDQLVGRFIEARFYSNGTLVTNPVSAAAGTTDAIGGYTYGSSGVVYS